MIIDTHVHIGGEAVGFHMDEGMVIAAMEKYGIDFSIVSNSDAGEVDHQQNLLPEELQVICQTRRSQIAVRQKMSLVLHLVEELPELLIIA